MDPPIAYNVAHDNALIVMVHSKGEHGPPAYTLGIDVMKLQVPRNTTIWTFVEQMSEQVGPQSIRNDFNH
jgi:4'-phosphopantetheinyl transferase